MQSKKGFTLVELLVVIAIIGILSSIAVVSVGNVRRLARDSKRLADIRQLQTALEMYFNENNAYPLAAGITNPATPITLGDAANVALCNDAGYRGFNTIAGCGATTMYLSKVSANPVPGGASYVYTPADADAGNNNRPTTYTVTFSLESAMAGYAVGAHQLSQFGMR